MPQTNTGPGVQSRIAVESSPVVPVSGGMGAPHTWAFIWFGLAVLVVLGFHVRVFGHPIPPSTHVPG